MSEVQEVKIEQEQVKIEQEQGVKRPREAPKPEGQTLKVGDVATRHDSIPTCKSDMRLAQVADLLLSSGQMAAAVTSNEGIPLGLITERDILRAYMNGAPWDCTVSEWFRGRSTGKTATAVASGAASASAPSPAGWDAVGDISVPQSQPLSEALPRLQAMLAAGDDIGLLVPGASGLLGTLTPLDLARAVSQRGWAELADVLEAEAAATVAELMEPLDDLVRCSPSSSMQQLLRGLLSSPAQAVLVTDESGVHGLATAADALWAFQKQICRSKDAWPAVLGRPGFLTLEQRTIPADAPMQTAAEAMGQGRHLVAVEPGAEKVIGVVSPAQLARGRRHKRRTKRMPPGVHPVTVGEIAKLRQSPSCSTEDTLGDACDAMVAAKRTASLVTEGYPGGAVCGILTENDILNAFVNGAPWDCSIGQWLRGTDCRMPGFVLPMVTLPSNASLAESAARMASMAEDGDLSIACHHILVCADTPESSHIVVSALDIARGMIVAAEGEAKSQGAGGPGVAGPAAAKAAKLLVSQAMKPRPLVPSCYITDTIAAAFRELEESRQNCALVVDEEPAMDDTAKEKTTEELTEMKDLNGGSVYGVLTTSDVVRAFSERQTGTRTTVAGWLRGLDLVRTNAEGRSVTADSSLSDAVTAMTASGVHHLVVLKPETTTVVGVVSALDIVCALSEVYRQAQFSDESGMEVL